MSRIIGIDFDNTIVNYENTLYDRALQSGFITPETEKDKQNIRNKIRELPDGELEWQKLQAFIYGQGMKDAMLFEGIKPFFDACRNAKICVSIVSHKTQFASMDENEINLRVTAMHWMKNNRFFDENGLGLTPDRVFFESTRREKIERIKQLGCTHFIDDLEETFLEDSFPVHVERILFAKKKSVLNDVKAFREWKDIYGYFFAK